MSQPLLNDLRDMLEANVIDSETAVRIESFYRNRKPQSSNRLTTALAILGALLAGSGIVLVIAHNWDELSRTTQTILGFSPLVAGQFLCGYAFLKKRDNKGWKEASAVFLLFAVATTISLVSQIYQVNGTMESFLMAWILLTLPLVYIMNSAAASLLIIALVTWQGCLIGYGNFYSGLQIRFPVLYVAVMLALAPHYLKYFRGASRGASFYWHSWAIAISIAIILGAMMVKNDDVFEWMFIGYMSLFGIYTLVGYSDRFNKERLLGNPFLIIGSLGVVVVFLSWTFSFLWEDLGRTKAHSGFAYVALPLALLAVCAVLATMRFKQMRSTGWELSVLSPLFFTFCVLTLRGHTAIGIIVFNVWLLALSVYYIRRGAAKNHLGILNFGLVIFASLACMRFFDDQIPFIWRGLMFLAAGSGFFIVNYLILRKRKTLAKTTAI